MPFVLLLSVLLLLPSSFFGQDLATSPLEVDKPPKFVYFKTNPLAILQGPIPFTAEYRFALEAVGSHRFTYQVGASYLNKSILFNALYPDSVSPSAADLEFPGYRLQAQVKYYFAKFSSGDKLSSYLLPTGAYVSLHSSYASATQKLKRQAYPRIEWSNFNINTLIGTQLLIEDYFGIDFFFGMGYKNNTVTEVDLYLQRTSLNPREVSQYYGSPLKIMFGFNLVFGLF